MFVLTVGLLSVAAMIPAGRFEIQQGAKYDHATMVGRAAYRDLKVRGYLNPGNWTDTTLTSSVYYKAPNPGPAPPPHSTYWFSTAPANGNGLDVTPAVAIDPLGVFAAYGADFPYGAATPVPAIPMLTRVVPHVQSGSAALADPIFRNTDDLLFQPSASKDLPPAQSWFTSGGTNLKRASNGDYSWLATVVTDPRDSALIAKITVSVAVMHKRDLSSPGAGESYSRRAVAFPSSPLGGQTQPSLSGGEVVLYDENAPNNLKPVKPGQWIMLAGQIPLDSMLNGPKMRYFRWYRVVSASDVIKVDPANPWIGSPLATDMPGPPYQVQTANLHGADWMAFPPASTGQMAQAGGQIPCPWVWVVDNVIAVYEKNMKLEIQ